MNDRSSNVELTRFIACMLIMAHHLYLMNFNEGNYHFFTAWIYVEIFLMITGYCTAKHYEGKKNDNKVKDAISYTITKYIRFFPYTILVTVLMYSLNGIIGLLQYNWTIKDFIFNVFLGDFAFDILFLSVPPLVFPLWYLTATIVIFPLVAIIVQIENRYWVILIASIYAYMYYGFVGVYGGGSLPLAVFRALAGMALGVLLYECIYLAKDKMKIISKPILTMLEVVTFSYTIFSTYENWDNYKLTILMFWCCLFIMFSNMSYTVRLKNKVITYLGKLSMPIFIFHWYTGTLINAISNYLEFNDNLKIVLYYSITIVISAIIMFFVDRWKWFQNIINKPIVLKD